MNAKYAAMAAMAAFVGCSSIPSVGPDYERPELKVDSVALPDAGSPTTNLTSGCEYKPAAASDDLRVIVSKESVARWWEKFNDPVLVDLVDCAVTNNISFQMAIERLSQAQWQLLGSYAAFLPKFAAGASWARYWNYPNTRSGSGDHAYNVRQGVMDGNWEIDIFGGNRRLTEASLAAAEAAGWGVADAWVALTTQIGQKYVLLRTTQELIAVARTNLVLQSETYDILKSRLDSGIGDELAVNQCAYVVEETRARIPTLLAEEESIKNAIAILAGEMPGELHGKLGRLPVRRDWLLAPQRVAELPLDLIRSRPDVMQAERTLAAETARIGVAKSQWFPKLYLKATIGWENRYSTPLFTRDAFIASLGPSVSWPIFQGGAIYADVKRTEARVREAALAYELAIANAYAEVRDAYAAYTQEYHRHQALIAAVKAATDAVTISKDLYKNGLKDFNNVLDAQRSRLQFEESRALSSGNITTSLIQLYKALGGGLVGPQEEQFVQNAAAR